MIRKHQVAARTLAFISAPGYRPYIPGSQYDEFGLPESAVRPPLATTVFLDLRSQFQQFYDTNAHRCSIVTRCDWAAVFQGSGYDDLVFLPYMAQEGYRRVQRYYPKADAEIPTIQGLILEQDSTDRVVAVMPESFDTTKTYVSAACVFLSETTNCRLSYSGSRPRIFANQPPGNLDDYFKNLASWAFPLHGKEIMLPTGMWFTTFVPALTRLWQNTTDSVGRLRRSPTPSYPLVKSIFDEALAKAMLFDCCWSGALFHTGTQARTFYKIVANSLGVEYRDATDAQKCRHIETFVSDNTVDRIVADIFPAEVIANTFGAASGETPTKLAHNLGLEVDRRTAPATSFIRSTAAGQYAVFYFSPDSLGDTIDEADTLLVELVFDAMDPPLNQHNDITFGFLELDDIRNIVGPYEADLYVCPAIFRFDVYNVLPHNEALHIVQAAFDADSLSSPAGGKLSQVLRRCGLYVDAMKSDVTLRYVRLRAIKTPRRIGKLLPVNDVGTMPLYDFSAPLLGEIERGLLLKPLAARLFLDIHRPNVLVRLDLGGNRGNLLQDPSFEAALQDLNLWNGTDYPWVAAPERDIKIRYRRWNDTPADGERYIHLKRGWIAQTVSIAPEDIGRTFRVYACYGVDMRVPGQTFCVKMAFYSENNSLIREVGSCSSLGACIPELWFYYPLEAEIPDSAAKVKLTLLIDPGSDVYGVNLDAIAAGVEIGKLAVFTTETRNKPAARYIFYDSITNGSFDHVYPGLTVVTDTGEITRLRSFDTSKQYILVAENHIDWSKVSTVDITDEILYWVRYQRIVDTGIKLTPDLERKLRNARYDLVQRLLEGQ